MAPDLDHVDPEAIAHARGGEVGCDLRDLVAGALGCEPEQLHPDAERRADA